MESLHEGHYHDDDVASEGRQAADGAVDVGDVLRHGVGEDDGEAAVEMGGIGWVRSSGSESGASASPLRGEGKLLVEDVSSHLGADRATASLLHARAGETRVRRRPSRTATR